MIAGYLLDLCRQLAAAVLILSHIGATACGNGRQLAGMTIPYSWIFR
jgi:hypothetical protein